MASRTVIVEYLTAGAAWSLVEPAPIDRPGWEWWRHSAGETVALPAADEWETDSQEARQRVYRLAARIAECDRVPLHLVTGATPFDPKTDPVLHFNGRGRKHYDAFRTADQERQHRHIRREHSSDPDRACLIAGTDSLTEAHEWLHDRFDH